MMTSVSKQQMKKQRSVLKAKAHFLWQTNLRKRKEELDIGINHSAIGWTHDLLITAR